MTRRGFLGRLGAVAVAIPASRVAATIEQVSLQERGQVVRELADFGVTVRNDFSLLAQIDTAVDEAICRGDKPTNIVIGGAAVAEFRTQLAITGSPHWYRGIPVDMDPAGSDGFRIKVEPRL